MAEAGVDTSTEDTIGVSTGLSLEVRSRRQTESARKQ